MRAIVCREFTDYHNLKVEAFPDPALDGTHPGGNWAEDGVLIDTHAAGLSFATSLVIAGKYQRKPPRPFTPGSEAAGVVTAVGSGVTHVKPGQRVVAALDWGGHAGRCRARRACVHAIPDTMSFEEATAFALSYPTSYGALTWRSKLQAGETLLVHGATGAVGIAAVEIGKALGATVIATASTEEKIAFAKQRGADHGIVLRHGEHFYENVRTITRGRGADVIFDPIGGDTLIESLRCTAMEGRLLTIGYAAGDIPKIPANLLLLKSCAVMGFNYGTYVGWGLIDERDHFAPRVSTMMSDLMRLYERGALQPRVSHRFSLDQFVEGLDNLLDRRVLGKSVVVMTDGDRQG